jgi:acetate kinase
MVLAHLGNGASLCAVKNGSSIATTMGFSALDGLMMGTRCGALDAGVVLYLLRQGWNADQLEKTLNKESGLLGVSGLSADMRTLRASASIDATQAISLFTHRVVRECGAMVACLNGMDVLAFTGGIGEHDHALREDVVLALSHLGLKLNVQANRQALGKQIAPIHAASSSAEIWVVPTDEGRVAATDAALLLGAQAINHS